MSYARICTVVNEHTASTVVARYAISIAAACKAQLVLYAAHTGKNIETELHMEHLATVATKLGIPVTRITEVGDITVLLPARVKAEKADLVFYPLIPYKRYGTDVQRHIMRQLLHSITSDLAIMRSISMAKPHPASILVPLGKVISSKEQRLMFISELAKSFHAQVTLYHVAAQSETKVLPDDIVQFRKQLEHQQIAVLGRNGSGSFVEAITVEVISRHIDLIVLGASKRGVFRTLFFGNPAAEIMHQPPCNTILFRPAQ